jgi:hypothetical protein
MKIGNENSLLLLHPHLKILYYFGTCFSFSGFEGSIISKAQSIVISSPMRILGQ